MAAPSKKHRKSDKPAMEVEGNSEDSDEDMDEGGPSDCEEGLMNPEIVNVDFEARNAEEFDFRGIKNYLEMIFPNKVFPHDLSWLADEIITRNNVGSVIKQVVVSDADDSDDDGESGGEVLGLVTVVDLMDKKRLPAFEKIQTLLIDRCIESEKTSKAASDVSGKFGRVLTDAKNSVGFIINERLVNMPAQIAPPFFESLWKEVERAKKKYGYNFEHYIMVARTFREIALESSKKKSSKKKSLGEPEQRIFAKPEEEIFFQHAEASFEFSVQQSENDVAFGEQWSGKDTPLEPMRTVLLISASKLPAIMARMKELYSQ